MKDILVNKSMKITISEFATYYNSLKFRGESRLNCIREHIVCSDGYKFSCQYGYGMYCDAYSISRQEQEFNKDSELLIVNFTTFELSLPYSLESLSEYDCGGVYARVPCDKVVNLINYHGGFKNKTKFLK